MGIEAGGAAPAVLGPYRLMRRIGRGGMGEVYAAFDSEQQRTVALKLLAAEHTADEDFRRRFRREAGIVARLREPHVIPIHRFGEIDGRLFLDMRLVEGPDLGRMLERHGAMSPGLAVELIGQLAAALDAAAAQGVVHRDVKPANVLLAGPRADFAYLVDFGIARTSAAAGTTASSAVAGSFAYLAPESFGAGDPDHRADVYALGCVLHECLTGSVPFPRDSLPAVVYAHLHAPPPTPSRTPGVPIGLDAVVCNALAKDPAQRQPSAGALAAAARDALATPPIPIGPTAPASPQPVSAPGRLSRRRLGVLGLAAVGTATAAVAAAVGAVAVTRSGTGSGPPPLDPLLATQPLAGIVNVVAIGPDGRHAYLGRFVDTSGAAEVGVLDLDSGREVARLDRAVTTQRGIGFTADGRLALLLDSALVAVDVSSHAAQTVLEVGGDALAVAPAGPTAYLVGGNRVRAVDVVARRTTAEIPISPVTSFGAAVARDGQRLFVGDWTAEQVTVVDLGRRAVVGTVPVGPRPDSIVVTPDGRLWVWGSDTLTEIDTRTLATLRSVRFPDVAGPVRFAMSPRGDVAYLTGSNEIVAVDTAILAPRRVRSMQDIGRLIAVSPDGARLCVVQNDPDALCVYDTGRLRR